MSPEGCSDSVLQEKKILETLVTGQKLLGIWRLKEGTREAFVEILTALPHAAATGQDGFIGTLIPRSGSAGDRMKFGVPSLNKQSNFTHRLSAVGMTSGGKGNQMIPVVSAAAWDKVAKDLLYQANRQYRSLPAAAREDLAREALVEVIQSYDPDRERTKTGAKQPVTPEQWSKWHGPHALSDAYQRWKRNPCTQAGPLHDRMFRNTVGGNPQRIVEACERRRAVRRAVSALPETLRQVVILFYFEERPIAEIAEELDLNQDGKDGKGCVKSRLYRAREHLRLALREWSD
jgi:RNA polymerase sigma factor (sigma-70 family)